MGNTNRSAIFTIADRFSLHPEHLVPIHGKCYNYLTVGLGPARVTVWIFICTVIFYLDLRFCAWRRLMITMFDLWAKTEPFQSVVTHGIVSGVVAQTLFDHFLSEGTCGRLKDKMDMDRNELRDFVGYFVSLHDIGKIHYRFQIMNREMEEKIPEEDRVVGVTGGTSFRHEEESRRVMKGIWKPLNPRVGSRFAEILGAHHQGKGEFLSQVKAKDHWTEMQLEYEAYMREHFLHGPLRLPGSLPKDEGALEATLLGLVILSDWIASGPCFADAESWEDKWEESRTRALRFIEDSGLMRRSIDFGHTFHETWPNIPAGQERELQRRTAQLFEGTRKKYLLVLLEAPMGEGKTEAGLYAAVRMAEQWKKNGFYVALPTSATANQMVGRMRAFLEMHQPGKAVRLLHSMAWMADEGKYDTEEADYAAGWLMPSRRALLSQYAVGTVDQAMMAAMFIKYGVLRLLGLSEKVVVIDEIHAYDAYMQNILGRLLEWCRALQIPVVLLSATLPPEKKQALISIYSEQQVSGQYPVVTAVTENGELEELPIETVAKRQTYRIEKRTILHDPEAIAAAAVANTAEGGCLCILLNTVRQAQETYLALKRSGYDGKLLLFHSRFTAERREEIEEECLKLFGKDKSFRPHRAILVATQVVEQSLDVDFDEMFSAVAPIDLLIQRMGRQFRHEETVRPAGLTVPHFTILLPKDGRFGVDGYVYPDCLLRQTEHLLEGREEIRVPDDIAKLVADGYDPARVPEAELEAWKKATEKWEEESGCAEKYKLSSPDKKFRPLKTNVMFDDLEQDSYLSAQTRLSEPSVRLALLEPAFFEALQPLAKNGELPVWSMDLARKILRRSVSIRKKKYCELVEQYDLLDLSGAKLLVGVKIMSKDNPCFEHDRELGLLWKE